MAMFEGTSLDDETDRDWRVFSAELADHLASDNSGAETSISPDFQPDKSVERGMVISSTGHGTFVCAASGLQSPPAPWKHSGDIHTLEEAKAWVDKFAAAIVTEIRHTWNVPHPSFLAGQVEESPRDVQYSVDPSSRTVHSTESQLADSVEAAVRAVPDVDVHASGDGSYRITMGSIAAYLYVASSDEVRIHAPIVERIAGRTRAAEVVADLNRRYPRLKFLLVEDRVHAALSIDANPFLPQHAVNAITRLAAFVGGVDDAFAENLGGVVAAARLAHSDEADTTEAITEVAVDEDVPGQLMTLLEIDAQSGGAVDAEDVVAVCGADRAKITSYETFCSEQAQSWRDYAQEALQRGESQTAAECEAEAVPWDRIVRALRQALRTDGFVDNA
ncbi:hypothetical protein A2J03_22700 [Rhodococcus sp. EPR-157]|uniref:T3SS (YopN, CesT) and YbjN peptide-binding chaperone 1 n=1 Tax=Rhodococcus sp. EPR-157 TaxID=1813677 RepID=UPI0007BC7B35|nr:hypothetical protein [Rhodococcus sp. EPR-157]KZF07524.1 hypothetical protein A2J03_22700 [Rhodococcus sp. EPR-157]